METPHSTARSSPLLDVRGVSAGYRSGRKTRIICADVSFSLRRGEIFALLGPNGAGKSTLLRALAGLSRPLAGEVFLEGRPLEAYGPRALARRRAVLLTSGADVQQLRVWELVETGRYPHRALFERKASREDEAAIRNALELTGTASLADRRLWELSDGERQKAFVARAVAQEAPLLLLDEPTAFLDAANRAAFFRLAEQLARTHGRGLLVTTHEIELALSAADLVGCLTTDGAFAAARSAEARPLLARAFPELY